MVLMKPQERQQYLAMRAQCGQERDITVKQVEGGYIVQTATRFFVDQGQGPVSVSEVIDTAIATSGHEAALIASNFLKHGEFWPDEGQTVEDEPEHVEGHDPVMPEQYFYREQQVGEPLERAKTEPVEGLHIREDWGKRETNSAIQAALDAQRQALTRATDE